MRIAIIGATGHAGRQLLASLHEAGWDHRQLSLFASSSSHGKQVSFGEHRLKVERLLDTLPDNHDVLIQAAGDAVSRHYARSWAEKEGRWVIDLSEYGRQAAPTLCSPSTIDRVMNGSYQESEGLWLALPHPMAGVITTALNPLRAAGYEIASLSLSTYQSVASTGKRGMDELFNQAKKRFFYESWPPKHFPRPIAFNAIPWVGDASEEQEGVSGDEQALMTELPVLLSLPSLAVGVTAVRLPVFVGDAVAIDVTVTEALDWEKIETYYEEAGDHEASGLSYIAPRPDGDYATPLDTVGDDFVSVGRIRRVAGTTNRLCLWAVADTLKTGVILPTLRLARGLAQGGYGS